MKIKIIWTNEDTKILLEKVNFAIDELWLNDFINAEITNDENLKIDLNISKEPALVIEEESIDFKDIIFEWIIPEIDELKSMFVSIIWWAESNWHSCDSSNCGIWCNSC